ncbi:unnamed protein product [Symbiodinium sp. CCMP2592]|nr:unnamed protein product [Symbiodinium sp. CCMP2592]
MIPGTLRQWLDGWGSGFQSATEASIGATHARFGLGAAKLPQRLLVGTDCSGIDAPIHGLRELGITHQHLFGSEVAAGPRSVIEANTKPSVLFHSVLDADKAPFVHLYIAGFSCKPFSLLHNKSRLLKEKQAQIFYGVVARIQLVRPSCFVLENVSGIKRVSAKVLAALRSTGYHVEMILMNPAELQEPIQRPRYYFIGVRQDVSLISPKDMSCWLREAWAEVLDAVASGDAVDLLDRLLPASHPAVAQYQESRKRKWSQASNRGFPGSQAPGSHAPKWKELHKMCKASMQQGSRLKSESRRPCTESGVACCADTLFLHLPRERDAWDIICTKHAGSKELVADVSQNVNRARVRTDGSLPTVTPGAVLVSARAGRIISPLEKVMLHGFPIHRMVFPSKVTDKELASMGGNTMHVQIVAVAMKFALALVNWSLPKASRPTALCSTVAAPSITASVVLGAAAKCRKRHGKPRKAPKARKAASAQKPPKAPKAPKAQKAEGMSALAKRWQKVLRPQAAKKCSRKGATATLAQLLAVGSNGKLEAQGSKAPRISMPVGSRTLRGLAARFGLRSRKQDRTPTKKRRGPQGSVPAAPKKLRLESGEGLAQEGDDDTGKGCGDVGLATESDAEHLARHRGGDEKCSRCKFLRFQEVWSKAGSLTHTSWGKQQRTVWLGQRPARRGGDWGIGCHFCAHLMNVLAQNPAERKRSAMQACCIHAHSKTFVHQVATKVYLAPDTPISQCLPYSIKHQHLFSGNVPQPADWLRAWRACRTASSFKGAVKFYSTEDFAAGRNTKLDSLKNMILVMHWAVKSVRKQRLEQATSISLSVDDRKEYRLVRYRCDVPPRTAKQSAAPGSQGPQGSQGSQGSEDGPLVADGLLGVYKTGASVPENTLEEHDADKSQVMADSIGIVIDRACQDPEGKTDEESCSRLKLHVRHFAADQCTSARKCGRLLVTGGQYPNLVWVSHDPAHQVRIAYQDPLHAMPEFQDQWERLFAPGKGKHALIPDIQNSEVWKARLMAAQQEVLRLHGSQAGVEKVIRALSFSQPRFDSSATPMLKYLCMIRAMAVLCAMQAADESCPYVKQILKLLNLIIIIYFNLIIGY